ncbi:CsbD family protein [Kitasatospora sp. NBC_00315]|uniref:CsbD family protein n=1 Tax=Kitasatospora sp. NBC_00315 TaxID=2975963 RepID=UPI00324E1A21
MGAGDKIDNAADKLKGAVKEHVGRAVGNERLEAEGRAERTKGDLKQAGEHVKDAFEH